MLNPDDFKGLMLTFAVFCACVGVVVVYILGSFWAFIKPFIHAWTS